MYARKVAKYYSSMHATKSMQKGSKKLGQTECKKIIMQQLKTEYKKCGEELGNKEFKRVAIN